jgi:hypothetical protein
MLRRCATERGGRRRRRRQRCKDVGSDALLRAAFPPRVHPPHALPDGRLERALPALPHADARQDARPHARRAQASEQVVRSVLQVVQAAAGRTEVLALRPGARLGSNVLIPGPSRQKCSLSLVPPVCSPSLVSDQTCLAGVVLLVRVPEAALERPPRAMWPQAAARQLARRRTRRLSHRRIIRPVTRRARRARRCLSH